jgi:DNA-binding response OmpR family regulator
VILCSGYSELTDRASLHEAGVCLFLMKPFNGRDLSVAIGRALAGKSLAS